MKKEPKGECDMIITVTHSDSCSCLVENTYCVICGEEEDLVEYFTANYYGLEPNKFCFDCAKLVHEQVIAPYEMRLIS